MRAITPGKCFVWAVLLSWPWILWCVARNSPEMILKGFAESTSVWMPILADIVLMMGGAFARHARRRSFDQPAYVQDRPHQPRPYGIRANRIRRTTDRMERNS